MDERRFNQIRAQLELWERMDPDHLDVDVLRESFADCRRLLGETVRAAEQVKAGSEAAFASADGGDPGAYLDTISKQAETIAAQADQIVSLSRQNSDLVTQLLKK
jgi:hypothetical protein